MKPEMPVNRIEPVASLNFWAMVPMMVSRCSPSRRGAPGRCVVLWGGETRKQGPRIAVADRPVLVGRQAVIRVQLGGKRRA
jgi:hypothetical protein